jgi:hypothetical protein
MFSAMLKLKNKYKDRFSIHILYVKSVNTIIRYNIIFPTPLKNLVQNEE